MENALAVRTSTADGGAGAWPTTNAYESAAPEAPAVMVTATPAGTAVWPEGMVPPSVGSLGPHRRLSAIPVSTRSGPHSGAKAGTAGSARHPRSDVANQSPLPLGSGESGRVWKPAVDAASRPRVTWGAGWV